MPTDLTTAGPPKWEDFEPIPEGPTPKWEDFEPVAEQAVEPEPPKWEDFEQPEPVQVLPPREVEDPTQPPGPWAFQASPYRQAPLPLPEKPKPVQPAETRQALPETPEQRDARIVKAQQEIAAQWRGFGPPTAEDVKSTGQMIRKAYRGIQGAPFALSEGAQYTLAWLSEVMRNMQSNTPGQWAPMRSPEELQAAKDWWRERSKGFMEAAKIPKEYKDVFRTISEAEEGPEEVRQVFESAGSFVPSLAVAPVGFPAMVAMAGLQSAGDNWAEGLERRIAAGESEEEARANAVIDGLGGGIFTALTTAAFGKTGMDVVAKGAVSKATKGAIVAIFREAGYEGTEEGVDQMLQIIWRQMRHEKMDLMEAIKYALSPEGQKEIAIASASGVILGGGVSSVAQIDVVRQKQKAAKEYAGIADDIQEAIRQASEATTREVTTRGGTKVQVPVQPGPPIPGARTAPVAPAPTAQGAQVVQEALAAGLPRTAESVARTAPGVPPPQLDLTVGREPMIEPTITPRAPAQTVPPVAQSTQAETTTSVPPPGPVEGAPGVSPAPAPTPAPEPAPAPTTDRARGMQNAIGEMFPHIADVAVVDNASQLPEAVRQDIERRGLDPDKVDAVFHNGQVIFNASRFTPGNRQVLAQKVVHEVGIHLGLRRALGDQQFQNLTQSIWRTLTPDQRTEIATRNKISPENIGQIGEEWLAYEAERVATSGKTNSTWTAIADAVRRFLRGIGITTRYSDTEIAKMISKGLRAAQAGPPTGTTYGAGSPLSEIDTIRYSYADVERATLEGEREYTPEIINAGMEGAFEGVKKMLYIEAKSLSDLIPPNTPWHQPTEGMSLIEYLRQFYSPEGIAAIRQTMSGERPPRFVKDKNQWYRIKAELTKAQEGGSPGMAVAFLSQNRKAGGISWDSALGTCLPSENCSVCYAKGVNNPLLGAQARVRHSLVTAMEPEAVGSMIAAYMRTKPKEDFPFLRINGSGDTTFLWQATAINTLIQNMDRPVHIFSRSHISRAPGTIGLDSISNGSYDPNDVENGTIVYKMGSIDRQLVREYGIPFLRENLEKRGIINSYLVKDVDDIPVLLELKRQGVFMVLHINRTNAVTNALREAGLIANKNNPELNVPSCYCALESGPFLNGCATCLVGGGPCFAMGSVIGVTPEGQMFHLDKLLSGEIVPPEGVRVVEMSRIGIPKDRSKMLANAAAKSYEMAAKKLDGLVTRYEKGKQNRVIVENPRDRTAILIAETKAEVAQAAQIAEDWRAYGKWLRGVVDRFENSAGLYRYVARYEMEEALSMDQALTEGIGAAERAARSADPMYSISEGVPQTAWDVSNMTPAQFAEAAKVWPGGLTGEAVRVGQGVTDEQGIDHLREWQAAAQAESKTLMAAGDFDNAMAAATKAQFFREAMETATKTGSMGHALQTGRVKAPINPPKGVDVPLGNTTEEGPPPGRSAIAPIIPDSQKIPEHDDDYNTRYSISGGVQDPYVRGQPISNESMERALREAGRPGLIETLGKPDRELLESVQDRMQSYPHWVDTIIQRQQKKPGLLSDEETLALQIYMTQLRTAIHGYGRQADAAEAEGDDSTAAFLRGEVDGNVAKLQVLAEVTQKAGTEAGRAFRARQLAVNWDMTLERMIIDARRAKGWKTLTEEELKRLEQEARAWEEKTAQANAKIAQLQNELIDLKRQEAKDDIQKIHPDVLEFANEWVANFQKRRRNAVDRFKVKWARAFPDTPLRTSVAPGDAAGLPDTLMRELVIAGASFLAENVTEQTTWREAMIEAVGNAVEPYLDVVRQNAEVFLKEEIQKAKSEMEARRVPRARPTPDAPTPPTVEEEIEETVAKIHQVATHAKFDTEANRGREDSIFYPVQKLVRQFVEQNPLITTDELIDQVHAVLQADFPDWTVAETRDAISGRGRFTKPSAEMTAKTVRELKAQIRILGHIADTEAQQALPPTGYLQDKPSPAQRNLLQRLKEAKNKYGEVVTDPEAQLSSYFESRKRFYQNRIADLEYEIKQGELRQRRTFRPQLEAEQEAELQALREELSKTKEEHDAIFKVPKELSDQERLELAERYAERLILKMEQDLAAGRKTFAGKKDPVASAKLEALRARIVQLKAEQEWAQMGLYPPPDLTKPEDIKRWFQLEREIRKIQEQLANQDVLTKKKRVREETPTNQKMVEQLEELKRQRQEMREALDPKRVDPVTRAINNRIAQIQRQIADYQQRLADQNFEPRKKKETPAYISENPDVVRLLAERERIKREFANQLNKWRFQNMEGLKKLWHGIKMSRTAITNLRSSYDFSALRQGMVGLMSLSTRLPTSPIKTSKRMARAFGMMFQAAFSRKTADRIAEAVRQKPNWKSGAYGAMNIAFTDIEAPNFNAWEENARSVFDEWAQLPMFEGVRPKQLGRTALSIISQPVAGSNRAFATFLNVLRSELADALLEENFSDRPPTLNELKILGNWVNVATGRGYVPPRQAEGWASWLWAPKLLMSRVQFLTGQPLWGGGALKNSAKARKIIAMEYARVLPTAFLLFLISRMFDEKRENDPRSSDFGKIVRGNTRIDIWGGHQQIVTFVSRMASGSSKSLRGRVTDHVEGNNYGSGGLFLVFTRFLRSKVRPDIGVAMDIAFRRDYKGDKVTVPGVLEDLFVPLPFADIIPILKDRGFTEGMILEMMNQFGAGVNTYEDADTTGYPSTRTR